MRTPLIIRWTFMRSRLPTRSAHAPARLKEGEAGRDAGGEGGAAKSVSPKATTDEGETSPCGSGRTFHRDAQTFLVHLFGRGLDDESYVVETYRSLPSGEIRPVEAGHPKTKNRRGPRRRIVSRKTVREMRPERDEIIVCTALNLKASGIQYWGSNVIWWDMLRR